MSTEVIPGADEATRSAFSCSTHDRAITTTWSPRSFTEIYSAERDLVGLTASITSLWWHVVARHRTGLMRRQADRLPGPLESTE